jgi:hypothetical protein
MVHATYDPCSLNFNFRSDIMNINILEYTHTHTENLTLVVLKIIECVSVSVHIQVCVSDYARVCVCVCERDGELGTCCIRRAVKCEREQVALFSAIKRYVPHSLLCARVCVCVCTFPSLCFPHCACVSCPC